MTSTEKNTNRISSSLLRNICAEQVNDLILEEELKLEGYKISYIIDPYDIQNYCYPFGLNKKIDIDLFRKKMTEEDKIDEFISFDILFQDKNNFFFILDEHLDELYDFQVAVKNHALLGLQLVDTNKILIDKFTNSASLLEKIDLLSIIEESSLSLILSIAMGYLRDGFKKIENITREDKRLFTKIDSSIGNEEIKRLIEQITKIVPSELTDDISKITFKIAERLQINESYIENKKYKFRNDSDVVDRVISLNKKLMQNNSKNICLFISSTSFSFRWFQLTKEENTFFSNQTREINKIIKKALPFSKYGILNPHRTSSQLFLTLILEEKDKKNKIANLERFRDSVAINFKHDFSDAFIDLKEDFWINRIQKLRDKSENYAVLSQLNKYQDTIKEAKKLQTLKNYKDLIKIFDEILQTGEGLNRIIELRDQNWRLYYYERAFVDAFNLGYKNLKELVSNITNIESIVLKLIKAGDDKIAGRYHILPVVFNLRDESSKGILKLYIDLIFTSRIERCNNQYFSKIFKTWLNKIAIAIENPNGDKEAELLRCLILLLLPDVPNREKIVLKRIDEVIEFELSNTNEYLKQEFYYLGSWVSRRINDLELAEKYSVKGIKNNDKDPRFYHSRSLTSYCNHYNEKSKDSKIKILKDSIRNAERAISLYQTDGKLIEINKSIISLYNTIVYCRSLIWDYNFKDGLLGDDIPELRDILEKNVKKCENRYEHYLEFLHTEAYLELLEFHYYGKMNEFTTSIGKIISAKNTIQKALKHDPFDEDCLELQTIITTAVNNAYK